MRNALIALAVLGLIGIGVVFVLLSSSNGPEASSGDRETPLVAPSNTPSPVPTATPTSVPTPTATPTAVPVQVANGTDMQEPIGHGQGEITISNGTNEDALVKLFDPAGGVSIRTVYVVRQSDWTAKNIPDGSYTVRFATGLGWDTIRRTFQRDLSFGQFEDPVDFHTSATTYSIWRITLHAIEGGTAEIDTIDAATFAQ